MKSRSYVCCCVLMWELYCEHCFETLPNGVCLTAHRSNRPDHYPVEQNGSNCRQAIHSPAGNRCHFVLLDKDESSPTADLSNIGRPSGPAYSTGELLNTQQVLLLTVCRLLGVDRVVAFAVTEWLQDIKKNQLPSLLGGVGPLYSLVQLGQWASESVYRNLMELHM